MAEELTPAHSGTRKRTADAAAKLHDRFGLRAGDALLIVDMQKDFLPGGALGVPEGDQVIAPLNDYIDAFESRQLPIFMTRDWHPPDHCSFEAAGGPWPPHCVRETPGAEWAEGLKIASSARIVSKATERETEAYSGFMGTELATLLRDQGVRRVFVGGLATDYCVRASVLDARSHGFEVIVLADAIRGVNVQPGADARAIEEMLASGATLFDPKTH